MRYGSSMALSLGTAGFLLIASLPAFSQDYARQGFYLELGVLGGSYTSIEDEIQDALFALGYNFGVDADEAIGFDIATGYRILPNFALEAEFEMLTESDISLNGIDAIELETWTLTGNLKAFLMTGRFQPYGLIGLGVMEGTLKDSLGLGVSETESDFTLRFGGGFDVYVTESVAVFAGVDYLLPSGDVENLDYVSFGVGVQYRF